MTVYSVPGDNQAVKQLAYFQYTPVKT